MNKRDYKNMWVYIEHDGKTAHSVGLELCCEIRKLCDCSGDKLYAVVIGSLPEEELGKVRECGVDGIINAIVTTIPTPTRTPSPSFQGSTIHQRYLSAVP